MKIGRNAPCPCGSGKKYKKCCLKKGKPGSVHTPGAPWELDEVEAMSTGEVIRRLWNLGVDMDREAFPREVEGFDSVTDLSMHWFEKYSVSATGHEKDFILFAAWVLWDRLAPEVMHIERVDEMIEEGYAAVKGGDVAEGCTLWLDAWEYVMAFLPGEVRSLDEAEDTAPCVNSLFSWCEDIIEGLWDAGLEDPAFHHKRIWFCRELRRRLPGSDDDVLRSMRAAEVQTHIGLGEKEKGDTMFKELMDEFPDWEWGYVYWGDAYSTEDMERAKAIYRMGVEKAEDPSLLLERIDEMTGDEKAVGKRKGDTMGYMKKTGRTANITKTEAWAGAELGYLDITASNMLPIFGGPITGREKIEALEGILEGCPDYYPARIDLGCQYIMEDEDEAAIGHFDLGLEALKKHFTKNEVVEAYYDVCDFLEKRFRFEEAIEYYTRLLELDDAPADVYDSMAYARSHQGDLVRARQDLERAVALDPAWAGHHSNLGQILMMMGDAKGAMVSLEEAAELGGDENITKQIAICKTMLEKDFKDLETYFLRPWDHEEFSRLAAEDDWDEAERVRKAHNTDRLLAFKYHLAWDPGLSPARKFDIFYILRYIMGFIDERFNDGEFLFEEAAKVEYNFKEIMHKFIFKTGDIDEGIFNNVYEALLAFYDFLSGRGVISVEGFEDLKEEMEGLKPELLEKMHKYNKIRHDDRLSENKKEEIRQELFEGDHEWPFL